VPALALLSQEANGQTRDTRIRFLGTPAGYEFVSLVQALLLAGGHQSQLTPENRARVAAVSTPTTIQVFSTPT
jgi:alkyl hydroperoxide reductase subunit AhpF